MGHEYNAYVERFNRTVDMTGRCSPALGNYVMNYNVNDAEYHYKIYTLIFPTQNGQWVKRLSVPHMRRGSGSH